MAKLKNPADIAAFATQHKLQKPCTDADGTLVIFGRQGQIFEFDDQRMGVIYSNSKDKTSERWNKARKACEAAGMELQQWGDREGALSFDPSNIRQSKLAIQVAGAKAKRQVSEATKLAGAARLAEWRSQRGAGVASA